MVPGKRGVALTTAALAALVPVKVTRESDGMDTIAFAPDGWIVNLLSVTVMRLASVVLQVTDCALAVGQRENINGTVLVSVPSTVANGTVTVRDPEAKEGTVVMVAVVPVILEIPWSLVPITVSATLIPLFTVV